MEQEKRDGHNSLWNNIGKLVVLASKTADQEEREWVMDLLEDYQINHGYMTSDLSKDVLQGDKSRVGIIPLLIFKYKVLRRWVSVFHYCCWGLARKMWLSLQEKMKTHGACFAAVKVDADQSWLGKLRPSSVVAFRLLEARSKHIYMGFYMGVHRQVCCFVWLWQIAADLCNIDRQLSSRGPPTMS